MKIFATFENRMNSLGIFRPKPFEKFQRFNVKNVFFFFNVVSLFLLIGLNMVHHDDSFADYSETFFGLASAMAIIFFDFILIIKTRDVFELIDNYQKLINQREYMIKISQLTSLIVRPFCVFTKYFFNFFNFIK